MRIHIQVGCLTLFTQKAIDDNNIPLVLRCFQFVYDNIDIVSSEIENALVISWVFHLTFVRNPELYDLFPPKLKELRVKLEEWENNLASTKNEKLKKFLNGAEEY